MKHDEALIQTQIVMFLQSQGIWCFSIPNENVGADPKRIGRAISMGMKPGVSDLEIWIGEKTVYAEIKTPVGKQSTHQKKFEQRCVDHGREYVVLRSVEDAMIMLEGHV